MDEWGNDCFVGTKVSEQLPFIVCMGTFSEQGLSDLSQGGGLDNVSVKMLVKSPQRQITLNIKPPNNTVTVLEISGQPVIRDD